MLTDAARNHRSWFERSRDVVELEGVTLFLGCGDAVVAFPDADGGLAGAVRLACESGAREIGCWALRPDDELGMQLSRLGFQDGWQPQWMGVHSRGRLEEPKHDVEITTMCARHLPYASEGHETVLGGDVHHFVVRAGAAIAGHAVLKSTERQPESTTWALRRSLGSRVTAAR
jgi:hypothetical protein